MSKEIKIIDRFKPGCDWCRKMTCSWCESQWKKGYKGPCCEYCCDANWFYTPQINIQPKEKEDTDGH